MSDFNFIKNLIAMKKNMIEGMVMRIDQLQNEVYQLETKYSLITENKTEEVKDEDIVG